MVYVYIYRYIYAYMYTYIYIYIYVYKCVYKYMCAPPTSYLPFSSPETQFDSSSSKILIPFA